MVILGVTLVPFLHGARVYTAYEYLERRFDAKTRSLTAFLFLISRGDVVRHDHRRAGRRVLGDLWLAGERGRVAVIGVPAVLYTMVGGVQAVTWVDVKQMFLIVGALLAVVDHAARADSGFAGRRAAHRRRGAVAFACSTSRSALKNSTRSGRGSSAARSSCCSYFGTDQSQVQRYLAAKSVDEARTSLLISAYWKIPLQALVLLVGVLVFVFYQFQRPPLLFNPAHERARAARRDAAHRQLRRDLADGCCDTRSQRAARCRRRDARFARHGAARSVAPSADVTGTSQSSKDVNYIIPRFVLDHLPIGLAGHVHRGRHRRGDERDLRRAQLAVDDDGDRLLSPLDPAPKRPMSIFSWCRAWRRASGAFRVRRRDVCGDANS